MKAYGLFLTLLVESQRALWDLLIAYVNRIASLWCHQIEITPKLY